ncbi:isoprenylcysteine carboxylmethyltransferase family protein [Nocardioides sp. zg-1230]|uniref:methyltransferase family protein n=1 Tax=Nocardioides sp. zg-1230 TaxID=2736601 RepID=UPI001C1303AE
MKRPPPPFLALVAAAAQQGMSRGASPASGLRRPAAVAVATASVAIAGGAASRFRAVRTTVEPFDPSKASSLVVTGPNSRTRNPMYLGMAGVLVANALRRGSWTGVLPIVGFVAVIDRFQVAAEERALAEKFGAAYTTYCASVPRWLGPRTFTG